MNEKTKPFRDLRVGDTFRISGTKVYQVVSKSQGIITFKDAYDEYVCSDRSAGWNVQVTVF